MNMNEIKFLGNMHTHKNMQLVGGVTQISRAKRIQATLGVKVAARYMALRGWSIESTLWILLGK